jgi:hypothetical protein
MSKHFVTGYIVVWDDGDCVCVPMAWAEDCEGALAPTGDLSPVAMFGSRSAARKAIAISAAFARLGKAQGKPYCDDFLPPASQCLRIVPMESRR